MSCAAVHESVVARNGPLGMSAYGRYRGESRRDADHAGIDASDPTQTSLL